MASNRPRGQGGLDIWVARRESVDAPFGAPENLPAPINSAADDFCPTPLRGGRLLFVSRRATAQSCGKGRHLFDPAEPGPRLAQAQPARLRSRRPQQLARRAGSVIRRDDGGAQLYFSRSSPVVPGDIYVSPSADGEGFGPAVPVSELNSAGNDIQPNVRKDGREIVFSSNHPHPGAQGAQDISVASHASAQEPWSAPGDVGPAVNKPESETRPSLSWDARTLLFGRAPGPEGMFDIYLSTRE